MFFTIWTYQSLLFTEYCLTFLFRIGFYWTVLSPQWRSLWTEFYIFNHINIVLLTFFRIKNKTESVEGNVRGNILRADFRHLNISSVGSSTVIQIKFVLKKLRIVWMVWVGTWGGRSNFDYRHLHIWRHRPPPFPWSILKARVLILKVKKKVLLSWNFNYISSYCRGIKTWSKWGNINDWIQRKK